jgi:hypothetical protein
MGLRIIDRQTPKRGDISEAERLQNLMIASQDWLEARGEGGGDYPTEVLAKIRRAKLTLSSPAAVAAMAGRIRDNILDRSADSQASHQQVDVATLLELL